MMAKKPATTNNVRMRDMRSIAMIPPANATITTQATSTTRTTVAFEGFTSPTVRANTDAPEDSR